MTRPNLTLTLLLITALTSACSKDDGENSTPTPAPSDMSAADLSVTNNSTTTEDMAETEDMPTDMAPDMTADMPPEEDMAPDMTEEDMGPLVVRLDGRLELLRVENELPALAAVVFDERGVIARGVTGLREFGREVAVTDQDKFHLGSCTKAMTATLVARLVERDELTYETTLTELFPTATLNADFAQVTVAQLLRHEAGLSSSLAAQQPELWAYMWQQAEQGADVTLVRADIARELLALPPDHTVGTFNYSNAGYIVLGAALEQLMQRPWEDLMREEVFEPLRMDSCGFGPPATTASPPDQPLGHERSWGSTASYAPTVLTADNPSSLGPAGTVHCAMDDWAAFAQVHVGDGPEGYLLPDSIDALHEAAPTSEYALGWYVVPRDWAGGDALNHAGSNKLNYAVAWLAPAKGMGVLIATNIYFEGVEGLIDSLAGDLIDLYIR